MTIEITAKDLEKLAEEIELATIPENPEIYADDEIKEAWELSHPEEV